MACYHPLKAFQIGLTASGKADLKITDYNATHVQFISASGRWEAGYDNFRSVRATDIVKEWITIPCGQCIGCRLDYSRQWANRLVLESQFHDDAYFITLTYNDAHLPTNHRIDEDTGELIEVATLVKSDLQKFLKRLRKHYPDCNLRFYAAGEYGDLHCRPHYHVIVFGLHLTDLQFQYAKDGHAFYSSKALENVWSEYDFKSGVYHPLGLINITDVSWQTCAYVARYVMKKRKGKDAAYYELHCLTPEFVTMSLKPGIGADYYDKCKHKIYDFDSITIPAGEKVLLAKPPRYFDKLYDIEYPEEMAAIRNTRKKRAEETQTVQLKKTSLNYIELLSVMEEQKSASIKKLIRPLED